MGVNIGYEKSIKTSYYDIARALYGICLLYTSTYEYSQDWNKGDEPYYPVNDEYNTCLLYTS